MIESISAYPLQFPITQPRTPRGEITRSQFKLNFAQARDSLLDEIGHLRATDVVLSTNIELRRDGLPYANRPEPIDCGVAVYFNWRNKPYCLACDKWDRVKDNMRAIALHIASMRGQERWGVGSIDQAFEGYKRLSVETQGEAWWKVLGVSIRASADEIRTAYRSLAKIHHPDSGGDRAKFEKINHAYEQAKSQNRL